MGTSPRAACFCQGLYARAEDDSLSADRMERKGSSNSSGAAELAAEGGGELLSGGLSHDGSRSCPTEVSTHLDLSLADACEVKIAHNRSSGATASSDLDLGRLRLRRRFLVALPAILLVSQGCPTAHGASETSLHTIHTAASSCPLEPITPESHRMRSAELSAPVPSSD